MEMNSTRASVPEFLSDLGKPTLRGIRKCPRCGTYNGTRGLSCKNKSCGNIFRCGARKQPGVDAVKIITGSSQQIFSVRQRDRGPDYRCFVELGVSETSLQTVYGTVLTQLNSGRCFLPSCSKAAAKDVTDHRCQHIRLAENCCTEAKPLTLKSSVLNSMQISPDMKQVIWQLATEPTGPLVQRVTRSILVVKCKASPKHSLGYLHVSFVQKLNSLGVLEPRFFCSCHGSLKMKKSMKMSKTKPLKEEPGQNCVHFHACVGAFGSDEMLSREFAEFLSGDSGVKEEVPVPALICYPESIVQAAEPTAAKPKKKKMAKGETSGAQKHTTLLAQEPVNSHSRKSAVKNPAGASSLKRQTFITQMDESQVSLTFQEWLASVTERIHQTMHYQFDGKPEPLVFHIPQAFFDALQHRISIGSTKKRLPNCTTAFDRKDALPLGTFSKYTWHITNISQVKQIFDTPELPLEVTRSFIQKNDGTYEVFKSPKVEVENIAESYCRLEKQPVARPLELKTFLKVGSMSPDQKQLTPFMIEWIPDILPQSKIGELRLKFEYGHQSNEQPSEYQEQHASLEVQHTLELMPLTTLTFP
ncbi:uncharacterized protein C2orf42 homolog isoform X2 [Rhinatrema bivittatum]|uniref:uncharacterized protein C2orf42 homolog isoform X2 n=1 Tax=Rhinatrema bivittatum TaxID=194408 RepID=UPI0011262C51|nr:uncharacterized protein C2orf42 homolog isoform X2 [Rhinatrema bivittatum]